MVITGKHILHSAFYLAVTLLCVAIYFIMLRAQYLAAVQILVYIGSVIVLIIFALMLTRTNVGDSTNISNNQKIFAALIAMVLFAAGCGWGWQVQKDKTVVWAIGQHSLFLMLMSMFEWG